MSKHYEYSEEEEMPKRFYWLKLQKDFFSSLRIKKLRKIAGGDTYTIIYLKMQLLSLDSDGYLEYRGIEESFEDEIALDIDEDAEDVKVAVQYLLRTGLIITDGDKYQMPYVIENTGSESSSAKRVRDFREREKQQMLQCNADVTEVKQNCNGEIEIEIEKELESEIDIEKDNISISKDIDCQTEAVRHEDIQAIVNAWNSLSTYGIPSVNRMSADSTRYKMLVARLKQNGITKMLSTIESIKYSSFLKGEKTDFLITFDWFVKPNNFVKVRDGNYNDRASNGSNVKATEGGRQ